MLPAWLVSRFAKDAQGSSGRRPLGPSSAAQQPIVERQDHAPSHRLPSNPEAAGELGALMARIRELAPKLCKLSPEELNADENDLVDLAARLDPSADSPAQPLRLAVTKQAGRTTDGDADGDGVDSLEGEVEADDQGPEETGAPQPKRQWALLPREVRQRARASRSLLVSAMMTPTATAKALSASEAVQALGFACGPTVSLASCSDCTASLANSRVEVVPREEGGALLSITSVSDDCRAKVVGGDAWVVRFESNTSVWRQVATDMRNGTYLAFVPREELRVHAVRAWVQLWYSSLEPNYLERRWWVLFGHTPTTGRSFPSLPERCGVFPCDSADEDEMQCRAATLPALELPRSDPMPTSVPNPNGAESGGGGDHGPGHTSSSTCIPEADTGLAPPGRWVDARKCAASFGRRRCSAGGGGAASFRGARVWMPFGCPGEAQSARCAPDMRRCLAGRKLLVVGDSVSNGFALDVCERLQGGGNCTEWQPARPPASAALPSNSEVLLSAVFGTPPRIGLRNVVQGRAVAHWTAALAAANNTIVVLQSGAHDIALPPPGSPSKVAPLAAYRYHLHELAHIVARAQAANPTLLVVWRQTTHQLLLDDAGSPEVSLATSRRAGAILCGLGNRTAFTRLQPRAYPGTHPSAITALNTAAREILSPLGVIIWEEPAPMTLSAPGGAFRDLQHHDVCGAGGDRHDTTPGARCAAERRAGTHAAHGWAASAAEGGNKAATWSTMGGVSEAITDSFFTSVLGCSECAGPGVIVR